MEREQKENKEKKRTKRSRKNLYIKHRDSLLMNKFVTSGGFVEVQDLSGKFGRGSGYVRAVLQRVRICPGGFSLVIFVSFNKAKINTS